jgi:hypothetical protein
MAKFEASQAADVLAVQQVIHEWASELDVGNGLDIAQYLTDDCRYTVRGGQRTSAAEVVEFYKGRKAEFEATPDGVPIHRHALSNMRVYFNGPDQANAKFGLVYFTAVVKGLGADIADPFSFADVDMDVRRCADGHWRIARFDSAPVFVRTAR